MKVLVSCGLIFSMPPAMAQTGTISGVVSLPKKSIIKRIAMEKYTGEISGKVAKLPAPTAGVWLSKKNLKAPASPKPQVLLQQNYQFRNGADFS